MLILGWGWGLECSPGDREAHSAVRDRQCHTAVAFSPRGPSVGDSWPSSCTSSATQTPFITPVLWASSELLRVLRDCGPNSQICFRPPTFSFLAEILGFCLFSGDVDFLPRRCGPLLGW